ncbi:hypothetical protein VNO78_23250 [Psophocarpus tetragonolobus]|uniref:Uncharacterized protein n=1 Tax=Psophocarpus tetragonolobus TaxID=3891 RepID=A0AAN9S6B3_PSOTE
MEKRAHLRVQKKKPIKRRGRKVLLEKVLNYLKSDTFMYAPLLSSPLSDFPSLNAFPYSAKVSGVESKIPVKAKKTFGEYLKSDVYMYAPLLHLPHASQEPLQDCGMIRMGDSTRRLTKKFNEQTDPLQNASSESHIPKL